MDGRSTSAGGAVGRTELAALASLTAAALALRLVHLTRFELFVDEAATWWFATLTAGGRLAEQMALEPTPPLYYAFVGALMRGFGDSDLVMRLPSAVFGAATIPAVYWLGRSLFQRRVGWIAALLLSVHPLHVFYSREARVYPLLLLLTVLLLWTLWQALAADRIRWWIASGSVLVAITYCHFYGLFLVLMAAVAVLLLARDRRARWRGLVTVALAGAAFSPYLVVTFPHLRQSGAAWSIETFYRDLPEEKRLGRVLEQQLVGADYHAYLRHLDRPPTPAPLRMASLLAQIFLLAWAACRGPMKARIAEHRRALGFMLLAWLLPLLVPWAITHSWRPIFHSGRHDVYTLGALTVLLAVGLDALSRSSRRWRWAAVVAAAVLVAGAGHRLYWMHRVPATQEARRAGAWIAANAGSGDLVVATGIRRLVTEHYTRLAGGEVSFESFPRATDDHPGWSDVMTLMEDQPALHREARRRVAALASSTREAGPFEQVFLLLRTYRSTADAVSATWLVDRHLVENLWAAGWRARTPAAAEELQIAVYVPPATAAGSQRGHPTEVLD
ncbi:MAG: glycosyltransferase family 39 protein, partial [Thermoanaerobaculia bacterium]